MADIYECECDQCESERINLAADPFKGFKTIFEKATKAFEFLWNKKKYKPEDLLTEEPYKELVKETNKFLGKVITDNNVTDLMKDAFKKDIFIFSHLRTHAQLLEASSLLLTEDGKIKGFEAFKLDIAKINTQFNENYLQAEYNFAVHSTQMAERWANLNPNKRFSLQYRTANDDKVRISHQPLHNITLPVEHPFWDKFYPPNGWRCRCTATQVRADRYEETNTDNAMRAGAIATTQIDKNGKNKLGIFQFNSGKQRVVFPPDHPYNKLKDADKVVKKTKESSRYDNVEFKKTINNNKGGVLEIFTSGKQNGQEFIKNKKAIEILVDKGEQYRLLPVIEDGLKNPDVLNLKTNKYADIKVAESTNGKSIIQNALKAASAQKVSEVIIHFTKELDSNREAYTAIKATFKQNRARTIEKVIIISPKNKVFTLSRNRFK